MSTKKKLKVTLVHSTNKKLKAHRACVKGLGLSRLHGTVEVESTPEICGMINKVNYLLKVEEI